METFLLAVALLWLTAASISDLKKREVPDWLSFSLLAIALATRIVFSISEKNIYHIIYGLESIAAFFLLSSLLYYTKVFAGGDRKIMIALGAIFSYKNAISFLFNVLIVGFFYCLVYSIALAIKNRDAYKKEAKKLKMWKEKIILIFFSLVLLFFILITKQYQMLWIVAFFFIFPFLLSFVKIVENSCLIKIVKPSELTEGDWLASDVKIGKRIIKARFSGLERKEIALIRKAGIKVKIKYGIPFVPVFLISLIVSLIFGNVLAEIAKILL